MPASKNHFFPRFLTSFPFLLFAFGICAGYILSLTVGVSDTPDSYLYFILAGYLRTGRVGWVAPFNWDRPQTLFGPVYGLFGSFMPNIGLPQMILLLTGAVCVFLILRRAVKNSWAIAGAVLYLFLPYQIIYSTMIMSEILTGFFVALYIFILYFVMNRSSRAGAAYLVFLSSVLTLTRYAYGLLFIISILLCFRYVPKKWYEFLCITAGISLLVWWMWFNYSTNGVWTLSMVSGRHVYNNVVYDAHLLPPETNPISKKFRSYLPAPTDLYATWWTNQGAFAADKRLSEWTIDRMYLAFALAAIQAHPFSFAGHVLTDIFRVPMEAPYIRPEYLTAYNACNPDACFVPWNPVFCRPALRSCVIQRMWGSFLTVSKNLQPVAGEILFLLAAAAAVYALFRGTQYMKMLAVMFLMMHAAQSALEIREGRFMIPLYPMYAVLIPWFAQTVVQKISVRFPSTGKGKKTS